MTRENVPSDYANSVIYEIQKAFWDERGNGARFRLTTVGREYFADRCLSRIHGESVAEIVEGIGKALAEEGIATGLSHEEEDRLVRLKIPGCRHQSVERRFIAAGAEPLMCVPANLVVLAVEAVLKRPAEIAEIKVGEEGCEVTLVLFEPRPDL